MNKYARVLCGVVATAMAGLCCTPFTAFAATAGPFFAQSGDGTYLYDVKYCTMVESNSSISRNIDGYTQISKDQNSNYRFISTYAVLESGIKTSSAFNGSNNFFYSPTNPVSPNASIYVGISAVDYQTGSTVYSEEFDHTNSSYAIIVGSDRFLHNSTITAYGSIDYRYPGAGMYEYVAVVNY